MIKRHLGGRLEITGDEVRSSPVDSPMPHVLRIPFESSQCGAALKVIATPIALL